MYVSQLSLRDFRNYSHADIELRAGVTIFQGSNGQGKTNLVEAIEYLSRLGSHRVSSDIPLVKSGSSQAIIRSLVRASLNDPRSLLLEVELNAHRANRARINRGELPKMTDLLGALRTVVFSPEDLLIVKSDPATRRAFIDDLVIARWPRMLGVKHDYERVLKQRNVLLKSMQKSHVVDDDILDVWDEQLTRFGAELLAARLDTLAELNEPMCSSYATIAPRNNRVNALYRPSFNLPDNPSDLEDAFASALRERRQDECIRAMTLIGPHRDDISLMIGDLPAKGYASHGESWSLALAIRLAAFHLLRADGIEAVLILDDVFAELDAIRRERLADAVLDAEQLLITAAVASDIPSSMTGQHFHVEMGHVEKVDDE